MSSLNENGYSSEIPRSKQLAKASIIPLRFQLHTPAINVKTPRILPSQRCGSEHTVQLLSDALVPIQKSQFLQEAESLANSLTWTCPGILTAHQEYGWKKKKKSKCYYEITNKSLWCLIEHERRWKASINITKQVQYCITVVRPTLQFTDTADIGFILNLIPFTIPGGWFPVSI